MGKTMIQRVCLDSAALEAKCRRRNIASWADLCRSAGVSEGTISQALKVNGGRVTLKTAYLIAAALGVRVEDIGDFTKVQYEHKNKTGFNSFQRQIKTAPEEDIAPTSETAEEHDNNPNDPPVTGWQLQLQLLYKEQRRTNDLLQKLVDIWEK